MKIPVVAPVTFVIPLPVSVNVAKAPETAPVKFAVTVPEDATVAVALIQRDTDALTLSEQVGSWALAEFKLPKLKSRTNINNLNLSKPVPNLRLRFKKRKWVDRCGYIAIDCV